MIERSQPTGGAGIAPRPFLGGDPELVRIMRVVRTGDRAELLETEVVPQFAGRAASAATLWPVRGMLGLHTLVRTVQGLSGACAMYPKRTVCCCLVVLLVASAASAQQVPPDDPVVKKALARNGGVIQIAPVPNYIRAKDPAARPTLKDFVDHLDHAITVAGIDHVGIGSDFDGGGGVPGFNNVADAPNVTIELVRRGYSEAKIRKIWGENLLRVWREVEQAAASPGPGLNEGVDSWRSACRRERGT
jgi:hypothetical protein